MQRTSVIVSLALSLTLLSGATGEARPLIRPRATGAQPAALTAALPGQTATKSRRLLPKLVRGIAKTTAAAVILNTALHLGAPSSRPPGDYLRDPVRSQLVSDIWSAAATTKSIRLIVPDGKTPTLEQQHLLYAHALAYSGSATHQTTSLFSGTTAAQRSDADHFFTAARLSARMGPLAGLALCVGWDLGISPVTKILDGVPMGAAFAYDAKQLVVDYAGVRFGAHQQGFPISDTTTVFSGGM